MTTPSLNCLSEGETLDLVVPAGLPALVGWVQHFAIYAEAESDDA